jgi:hypothetical protein
MAFVKRGRAPQVIINAISASFPNQPSSNFRESIPRTVVAASGIISMRIMLSIKSWPELDQNLQ